VAGLIQAELAKCAGLSVRGLNDLERGASRTPRRDTVVLLGDALGLAGDARAAFVAAARHAGTPSSVPPLTRNVATARQERPSQEAEAGSRRGAAPQNGVHVPVIFPPSGTLTFLFADSLGL